MVRSFLAFREFVLCGMVHLPNNLFAFAFIFAALLAESFPAFTICVALAFALIWCDLSGIGYFREPGRPKTLFFSSDLTPECNFAKQCSVSSYAPYAILLLLRSCNIASNSFPSSFSNEMSLTTLT
jgi:hypothetical protein